METLGDEVLEGAMLELNTFLRDNHVEVGKAILELFAKVKKRDVPTTLETSFIDDIIHMAPHLQFAFVNGVLNLQANGRHKITLLSLERGTAWFEGLGDKMLAKVADIACR